MSAMGWRVKLNGIVFQGHAISGEAVRRFQREVKAAGEDASKQEAALYALLRLAFPLTWAVFWKGDPVRLLLQHPERRTLLEDFFASLATNPPPRGNQMSGIDSRQPIAIQ